MGAVTTTWKTQFHLETILTNTTGGLIDKIQFDKRLLFTYSRRVDETRIPELDSSEKASITSIPFFCFYTYRPIDLLAI
jgi:hypothetical protein